MIIDNKPVDLTQRTTEKLGNHVDTYTNQVMKVQYDVDESILKLATELETLKTLANSKNTFAEFVTVADRLLEGKYDGKNSLDVIYENKDLLFDNDNIDVMSKVRDCLTEIKNVADNLGSIDLANKNTDDITTLVDNLLNVELVSKSIVYVQRLGNHVDKMTTLHKHIQKLIVLFDNIRELDTIFNYLPYLLRLNKFLKNYYAMAQAIVSKFDSYNKAIDTIILEMMEMNRNLTYQMKVLRDDLNKKIEEIIKRIEAIEAELVTINEKITQIEERLTKIEEIVNQLDQTAHTKLIAGTAITLDFDEPNNTYTIGADLTNVDTGVHTKLTAGDNIVLTHDADTNTYTVAADLTKVDTGVHTSLVAGDNIVQLAKDDTTNTYTISVDSAKITTGDHTKIAAGTNVTVTHDETTNTYTINSAGDGGTTITQEVKYTNFNL